jgi:hypothetical protein
MNHREIREIGEAAILFPDLVNLPLSHRSAASIKNRSSSELLD